MNAWLIAAGALGVLAACIHGGAGEILVVRKLAPETLPGTSFGGPRMTRAMIHVSWHIVTAAFLTAGVAMLVAGLALDGDALRAVGVVGAAAFTGFGAIALLLGAAHLRSARSLYRHPGPLALTATAVLAWLGAL